MSRRQLMRMLGGGLVGALAVGPQGARAAQEKKAFCHATGDPANPYTVITVAEPAWEMHLDHGDKPYVNCCLDTDCPGDETCGGLGVPGECGGCSTRTTCAAEGVACGPIPDGCGGQLECGSCGGGDLCNGPETCTGGQCQPGAPVLCPEPSDSCYVAPACDLTSGCGEPTYRGDGVTCSNGRCYLGGCCFPYTCATHPVGCGQDLDDGCGGTIDCGVPVPDGGCATRCGNSSICQTICGTTDGVCLSLGGDGLDLICRKPTSSTCAPYGTAGCAGPGSVCAWMDPAGSPECYEVCYTS